MAGSRFVDTMLTSASDVPIAYRMTMPRPHPAQIDDNDLLSQCDVRRQRRSGPGGQHRNKVETGVFLEHRPTGVRAEATEKRSQPKNQETALRRLRLNLAIQVRTDASDDPSALWLSRIQGSKIVVSEQHADFATLLSESLDTIAARTWDVKSAAEHLRCTSSQLIKFLKKEPRAFALINQERTAVGLGILK